jgi:NAD(P)-dependent dehydrogenase (short-subunit alcohol dehydrogenase family)
VNERRIAVVTGGGRGIGRAIAEKLSRRGFDLAVVDVEEGEGRADSGAVGRTRFLRTDVAEVENHGALIAQIVADFGRIDCLVSNAGIGAVVRGDLLDLKPANFDRVLSVNLRGAIFFSQAVARWMVANPAPGRTIINITSVSAEIASPERMEYCVAKAGHAMWSAGLALRLAREGIAVFDVRPGVIRTGMTAAVAEKYDRAIANGLVPAGRWGEPADVASVVAALAGGDFSYATGSVIHADGGLAIPRL